ncbi:MAG TPA: hypothetical protein VH307_13255 [Streptosporangiaceae bacterium]|jgi:hypothetical protein|nr:hypothetical protein [Streptosporangiaceae bacterium]
MSTRRRILDAELYAEAIASFQQGGRARLVYARGNLEWDSPGQARVDRLNRKLAGGCREWMTLFMEAGKVGHRSGWDARLTAARSVRCPIRPGMCDVLGGSRYRR